MRTILKIVLVLAGTTWVSAQTAEELVAKNLQAKGGLDKIKQIKSLRMTGRMQQGGFTAQVMQEAKAPDLMRQSFTIQGMTAIQAFDGQTGWQISPFEGRKDPELLGEDDLRPLVEEADFYGPLVDYREKGNRIDYLGHDTLDGDDVYRLKVTLKNGDVCYYYLDPDSSLEIRVEWQRFIRGAVRESVSDLGSYKLVAGVYYPFSVDSFPKSNPNARAKVTLDKIEANVELPDSVFKMPAAGAPASPSAPLAEPPAPRAQPPGKAPATKPPATAAPKPPKK